MQKDPANTEQMRQDAADLLEFTVGVSPEFHEPDNSGVELSNIVGTNLNNAMGEKVYPEGIERGWQEVVVILSRLNEKTCEIDYQKFNLATLFALARVGAAKLLSDGKEDRGE